MKKLIANKSTMKSMKNYKSYNSKVNTNVFENGMPKEGSHCICLSIVLSDSVFKMGKSYYRQVCKYVVKQNMFLET